MSPAGNAPCPAAEAIRREEIRREDRAKWDRRDAAVRSERAVQLALQAAERETGYECPPGQYEFLAALLEKLLPE